MCSREKLQEKICTLGISDKVQLLGFREDVSEICRIADVYCFPSIREGLSVSMLEAMSCALPIVCSNIRGNRDLVEDKNGGFLCDCRNSDEFCTSLRTLYDNRTLCEKFGQRNTKYVDNYNADSAKHAMEKIIYSDMGIQAETVIV